MSDIGTLGGTFSAATAVNSLGAIAGWSTNAVNQNRAFLRSGSTMTEISALGIEQSMARGMNDAGQILGPVGGRASGGP